MVRQVETPVYDFSSAQPMNELHGWQSGILAHHQYQGVPCVSCTAVLDPEHWFSWWFDDAGTPVVTSSACCKAQ